jgi:hypothetical protein
MQVSDLVLQYGCPDDWIHWLMKEQPWCIVKEIIAEKLMNTYSCVCTIGRRLAAWYLQVSFAQMADWPSAGEDWPHRGRENCVLLVTTLAYTFSEGGRHRAHQSSVTISVHWSFFWPGVLPFKSQLCLCPKFQFLPLSTVHLYLASESEMSPNSCFWSKVI